MNKSLSRESKKGLFNYLKGIKMSDLEKVNKTLREMVEYTVRQAKDSMRNVTKADLYELAKEVQSAFSGEQQVLKPVENSIKAVEKTEEEPKTDDTKKTVKKSGKADKKTNKTTKKTTDKKESPVKVLKSNSKHETELAEQFPKTLDLDGATYKVNLDIESIEDLSKAVYGDEKELVFAFYWNKRHLRQFNYDPSKVSTKKIKEFPNDLDITTPIYISEDSKNVAYLVSVYSEVLMFVTNDELKVEEQGLRFCKGVEFSIYEKVTK